MLNLTRYEIYAIFQYSILNLQYDTLSRACQTGKPLDDYGVPGNGGKLVFSWVYHPEALPLAVPGDTIHMAALRGMDVTVLRPDGFGLPEPIMKRAENAARASGGSVTETADRSEAINRRRYRLCRFLEFDRILWSPH